VDHITISNTEIIVHPEKRKEFFQTVMAVSENVRREKGCMSFRLYEETGNENSLMLIGEWCNKDSWDRHRSGENFAVLHGLVQVLSIESRVGQKVLTVVED
jgi:quinol monooxygenase YgiN